MLTSKHKPIYFYVHAYAENEIKFFHFSCYHPIEVMNKKNPYCPSCEAYIPIPWDNLKLAARMDMWRTGEAYGIITL